MPVRINKRLVAVKMAEREWTLGDMAHHSGIHENTLRRMMRGETFNSDTLGKLAQALNLHPVDLIEMDAPAPPVAVA